MQELSQRVDSKFPDILQTASELIRIPSRNPPGEERHCAEYIHSRLKEFGLETFLVREPFNDRPQVVALARGKSDKTMILNGHIDTVPEGNAEDWSVDPFSGTVKDDLLYGRGAVDMKSALAMMMHITDITNTDGNILLTFAVGEERAESGTSTLLSYIKKFNLNIKYGLVLEPTSMKVATCQKGAAWFRVRFMGRAAHASTPENGINAIEMATRAVNAINDYRKELKKRGFDSPTCTITMIGGGFKENVVPDRCDIVIDRRMTPGETSASVEQEVTGVIDRLQMDYHLERIGSREPAGIDDNSLIAREVVNAVTSATGARPEVMCFSGATDNEHLVSHGIESLVWGPGDLRKAHAVDECISTQEIKHATLSLALLLKRLLG
jgi:succinyl-diaminopimelate desuccinylase